MINSYEVTDVRTVPKSESWGSLSKTMSPQVSLSKTMSAQVSAAASAPRQVRTLLPAKCAVRPASRISARDSPKSSRTAGAPSRKNIRMRPPNFIAEQDEEDKMEAGPSSAPMAAMTQVSRGGDAASDEIADIIADKVAARIRLKLLHMETKLDDAVQLFSKQTRDIGQNNNHAVNHNLPVVKGEESVTIAPTEWDKTMGLWDDPLDSKVWAAEESRNVEEPLVNYESEEDAKPRYTRFSIFGIAESPFFSGMSLVIIVLNTAFTIYSTSYVAKRLTYDVPWYLVAAESFFIWYYAFEVLIKLAAYRFDFFKNEEWTWNVFDLGLVTLAIVEVVVTQFLHNLPMGEMPVLILRGLRVFKIARVLRIFRALRFLRELRLMMACVVYSFSTLLWAVLFIVFIILIASLIFVQIMTNMRIDNEMYRDDGDIIKHFGSVTAAMTSLFEGCTGGIDWGDLRALVQKSGPLGNALFLFFIVFFQFAFFNIVTSIFVERAMKLGVPDEEDLVKERRHEEKILEAKLRRVIDRIDADHSGNISLDELQNVMTDDGWFRQYFELHGLKIQDVRLFFQTLTALTHSETLQIDDFVAECMKVKGFASSLDMQAVRVQVETIVDYLDDIRSQMDHSSTSMKNILRYDDSETREEQERADVHKRPSRGKVKE